MFQLSVLTSESDRLIDLIVKDTLPNENLEKHPSIKKIDSKYILHVEFWRYSAVFIKRPDYKAWTLSIQNRLLLLDRFHIEIEVYSCKHGCYGYQLTW